MSGHQPRCGTNSRCSVDLILVPRCAPRKARSLTAHRNPLAGEIDRDVRKRMSPDFRASVAFRSSKGACGLTVITPRECYPTDREEFRRSRRELAAWLSEGRAYQPVCDEHRTTPPLGVPLGRPCGRRKGGPAGQRRHRPYRARIRCGSAARISERRSSGAACRGAAGPVESSRASADGQRSRIRVGPRVSGSANDVGVG